MINHDSPSLFGAFAIITASLLWGTTGTAASFAPTASPLAIGAFAMGIGGLLQGVMSLRKITRFRAQLWQQRWKILAGGVGVMVYPLTFYSAMHLAGVAIGTVVSLASAPLFSALLERLLEQRPFSRIWLQSFVLGAMGMVLLAAGSGQAHGISHSQLQILAGIVLGLMAGLSYALYSWTGKSMIAEGVPSSAAMGMQLSLGALFLLPTLLWTGTTLQSPTNMTVALYMALGPMFVGYLLFGIGLRTVTASQATLITLLEPLIATVLAVTIVGESLSFSGWGGMVLIFISLIVLIMPRKRPIFRLHRSTSR